MKQKGSMLIIVTIIGILTSLGARQFGNAITRANIAADKANALTIRNALLQMGAVSTTGKLDKTEAKLVSEYTEINKYISSIPEPKAVEGNFYVEVNEYGEVTVVVSLDGITFTEVLPIPEDPYDN